MPVSKKKTIFPAGVGVTPSEKKKQTPPKKGRKKNKDKNRKLIRQEKRKLPEAQEKVGPARKGLKGAVEELKNVVELSSTQCASRVVPLRIEGFARIVAWFIDRLSKDCPNLFLALPGQTVITPKDVYVYCHILLFSSLKQSGTMTGNLTQNLPDFKVQTIPFPIAKAIQYLRPLISGDGEFKQSYDFDMGQTVGTSAVTNGQYGWPMLGMVYDNLAPVPGINLDGHLFRSSTTDNGTWSDWVAKRLDIVSTRIKQMVGGVSGSEIGLAPDGSAYTFRDSATAGFANIGSLSGLNLNWEVAQVFSSNVTEVGINALYRPLVQGSNLCIKPSTTNTPWIVEDQIASTFVFLLSRAKTWPKGPIEEVLFQGSKLKSLIPNYKRIYGTTYYNVVGAIYAAASSINPNFNDQNAATLVTGGPLSKFMQLHWVAMALLHKRIERHSPTFSIAGLLLGNFFFPQAWFNPGLDGISIPPVLRDYINSVGCVNHHGYMVVPTLVQIDANNTSFANFANQTFMQQSVTMTPVARNDTYQFPFYIKNPSSSAVPPVPEVVLGNMKYDATFMNSWTTTYASQGGGAMMPTNKFPQLQSSLSQLYATVGNLYGNMVEYSEASAPFGTLSQMLTQGFGRTAENIFVTDKQTQLDKKSGSGEKGKVGTTLPTYEIAMEYLNPSVVVSAVPLNNVEILCAIAFNFNSSPENVVNGPETIQLQNVPVTSNFLRTASNMSFTPNVLGPGMCTGKKPLTFVKGQEIVKKLSDDDEKAEEEYRETLCLSAAAVQNVAPYACSGLEMAATQIPLLGGLLKGRLKDVCESGIEAIVHYVLHRCMTTSKETLRPKLGNVYSEAKRELTDLAIAAGLSQSSIKQLLKGANEVFKTQASFRGRKEIA